MVDNKYPGVKALVAAPLSVSRAGLCAVVAMGADRAVVCARCRALVAKRFA